MKPDEPMYQTMLDILHKELIPATGCTEPVAVAYCAALAREALGEDPTQVKIAVSGNIIKNVKSVIVPNTGGLKGIPAAAAAGIVAGDPRKELETIAEVSPAQKQAIKDLLDTAVFTVTPLESEEILDIHITLQGRMSRASARIAHSHTHVVMVEKDGVVLQENPIPKAAGGTQALQTLSVEDIYNFAQTVRLEDIREVIGRQIRCNTAISQDGLENSWGANIGSTILSAYGEDIRQRAKAAAAAGSDARMSGCEMSVVVNSGSGNQGMTVSLPVIEYARALGSSEEQLYRALVLSNLIAIHQKQGIGCLSAYCGAVSAGAAAGCGIAYLRCGDEKTICHTLVNALAITSGMVCDGAKPSCAAKVAISVDAGIMGLEMYLRGNQFRGGEGIVSKGVENTIHNVSRLGSVGMRETDKEIIRIMTE